MEISKNLCVAGPYQHQRNPLNWESILFAKVVFLDKTHASSNAHLYQLKDSDLNDTEEELLNCQTVSLSKDSFIYIGEVQSIDKKRKQIVLVNKNTVSYHHLVTMSGTSPIHPLYDCPFLAGLQTLIDALKVKPKIPNSNEMATKDCCKALNSSSNPKSNPEIQNIMHIIENKQIPSSNLNSHIGRLYEVQL